MLKKILFGFTTVALAIGSAATTYHVTLFQSSVINGTELKPGDYKVEIKNDKAVFSQGKNTTEAPVKVVEDAQQKYRSNVVRYGPESRVQEMRIGGTRTKLVFGNDASNATPAGQ